MPVPSSRRRRRTLLPREVMATFARPAAEIYAEIFSALQEPLRLRILTLIASALEEPEGEYACTSLEANLPVTKSTISYHVKILRKANLISVRKVGRYYRYTVREEVVEHFLPGMLDVLLDEAASAAGDADSAP